MTGLVTKTLLSRSRNGVPPFGVNSSFLAHQNYTFDLTIFGINFTLSLHFFFSIHFSPYFLFTLTLFTLFYLLIYSLTLFQLVRHIFLIFPFIFILALISSNLICFYYFHLDPLFIFVIYCTHALNFSWFWFCYDLYLLYYFQLGAFYAF